METEYVEQFWRAPKYEDAAATPYMTARFRDEGSGWEVDELCGFDRSMNMWCGVDSTGSICEVYDPPEGFAIGEGYRLVDIVKDNPNRPGIEFWDNARKSWFKRPIADNECAPFIEGRIYRIPVPPKATDSIERVMWNDKEYFVLARFTIVPKAHSDANAALERVVLQEVHDDHVPL